MELQTIKEKKVEINGITWNVYNEPCDETTLEEKDGTHIYISFDIDKYNDSLRIPFDTEERRIKHDGETQLGYNIGLTDGKVEFGSCICTETGLSFSEEYYSMSDEEKEYILNLVKSFELEIQETDSPFILI